MAEVHEEPPKCKCNVPAKIYTVRKPGPNTGRQFYKCGKGIGGSGACNFFQWASTESGAPVATPPTPLRERVQPSSGGVPPPSTPNRNDNNNNRYTSVSSLSRPPPFSYDDPNVTPSRLGAAGAGVAAATVQGPPLDFPDSPTSAIRGHRPLRKQSRLTPSQEDQSSQSTLGQSSLNELVPSSSVSLMINPPLVQAQLDSSPSGRTFLDQLSSLTGSVSDTLTRSLLKDKTIERQARKIVELEAEIEILNNRLQVANDNNNNNNSKKRSRSISFDDDIGDMGGDDDDFHLRVSPSRTDSPEPPQTPQRQPASSSSFRSSGGARTHKQEMM